MFTAALILLGAGSHVMLCYNWLMALLLGYVIQQAFSRLDLKGGSEFHTIAIVLPLLTAGFDFIYCHLPQYDHFYKVPLLTLVLTLLLSVTMSLWQRHHSPFKCMLLGLLIGTSSTFVPHTILWLLFFPVAGFYMRCWSSRNVCSVLTGTALAIWCVYCVLFFVDGAEAASAMLHGYSVILQTEDYALYFHGLGLWQYLFIGLSLLLLLIYNVSGYLVGTGQSVRSYESFQMLATISLLFLLLMAFDLQHFLANFGLITLLISQQLTIHQSSSRSAILDWIILLVIAVYFALCIAPLFL